MGVADSTDSTQPLFLGPCVPLLVGGRWDTPLAELRRGSVRVLMLGHQAGPAVRMGRALGEARVIALGAKEYTESERDELRLSNQAESGRGDGHSRGFYHGVLGCAFPFSEFIDHHAVLNEKKPASRIAVFEKVLDQAGAQERATLEPEDGRGIRRIARAHLDSLEEPFEGAE